ncbi:hypothetical protein PHLCEN_2v13470 [Hermanssonia centrifuga]|uniref:Lariat debranching enzyme C-terminal domain-containing protein n=1 Tax=Hermanssonia centrifuga TaxID=98765 RepID=A0A2R6NE77_9APHY|nr:hypothetical protein PHLCEN_2v13470 [Hermanssonia centrifuga]
MKIAIEGCCHGELDAIYSQINHLESQNNYKVSLLLICGDFQAIRNLQDLQCMAVPDKYKKLGEFYKYYTGEKKAPILTIIIGGNHEASNYLWELYHGGWLAPNIYFLGHAGCVQVNGIRIAGASGIFQHYDFFQGHFERLPYDRSTMRSTYHIREYNVLRLSLLSSPSIFLSHDWPQSIEHHGNLRNLLARKTFLKNDINSGKLGSPPLMGLLRTLKPKWWFSAHLHTRFEARVIHEMSEKAEGGRVDSNETGVTGGNDRQRTEVECANPDEIIIDDLDGEITGGGKVPPSVDVQNTDTKITRSDETTSEFPPAQSSNPDEIKLDDEEEDVVAPPPPPPKPLPIPTISRLSETRFLALDKCLPRRQFLEVIDLPSSPEPSNASSNSKQVVYDDANPTLAYDPEWLAITRAFNPFMSVSRNQLTYPDEADARSAVKQEIEWVRANLYGIVSGTGSEQEINRKTELADMVKAVESCQRFEITAPGGAVGGNSQPFSSTNPPTGSASSTPPDPGSSSPPPPASSTDPPPPPASSNTPAPSSSAPPVSDSSQTTTTSDVGQSSSSSSQPSSTSSSPPITSGSSSSSNTSAPPTSAGPSGSSASLLSGPSSSIPTLTTQVVVSTQPNGNVVTSISTIEVSGAAMPTTSSGLAAQNDNTSSKGFFDNKGAVAGVFAVVGLIALVLLIALVTNAVRRRQAKKFDRDVAEAAAEAAASARARPDFDDDDFSYGANRSVYTDVSHGTYSQQPLQHMESYNMTELPPFDSYAGVGAANLNRSKSQTAPYNAFAGPGIRPGPSPPMPSPPDPFYDSGVGMPMPNNTGGYPGMYGQAQPYADPQAGLLQAAGLTGGAGIATGAVLARGPSHGPNSSLSRNKSSGSRTLGGISASDHQHETYASHYQPQPQGYPPQQYSPPQDQTYPLQNARPVSMTEDPYAGYTDEPSPHISHSPRGEQFAVSSSPENESEGEEDGQYRPYQDDEQHYRESLGDEEDYGYGGGRRVLKVANE